ncbi:acetyl-CoA sensor PanZ family protein [Thalassolituus alkanivorans]|uniref:acetyl-CoA sensor PanZ family protein n=1 Tax=Thalassolituus alkanivorans TaxID=2881055 RepID=UPI001E49BD6C|nr:acetyl-CoA sensor PanZ family protein [Thalassolituus alkanivorans]MCB2386299.1 PanM family protein [Thalassolituus alkanivorans]MCB2424270.1 PanM family protein [Thalassolituus alkanivorans]
MPVKLEHIQSPADADWNDLDKIHQETATNGLLSDRTALEQHLQSGGWIMAGRFNDRIIGVMLANESNEGVLLQQAAVRTITQRRGVMHQLLHFIQQWATDEGKTLLIEACPDDLTAALQHRGFTLKDNLWTYNPDK